MQYSIQIATAVREGRFSQLGTHSNSHPRINARVVSLPCCAMLMAGKLCDVVCFDLQSSLNDAHR